MTKLIVFDLDDTLYNERDFVYGAFREVCIYLSEKQHIDAGVLFEKCIEILKSKGRGQIFNILCSEFKMDEDISTLIGIYRSAKPKLKLYEDAEFVLNKIRDNFKSGIITDGMALVQWNKLKCLGLERRINKIIVTDELGKEFWKPHIRAFKDMLLFFGVQSSEAVYVGDNPNKDFIGAREAGYKSIRIVRKEGDHMSLRLNEHFEADHEIYDLRDIFKYI